MNVSLTMNSSTYPVEDYSVYKTGSSHNFKILEQCLTPLFLAATVATSSTTMPIRSLIFDSAVSVEDNIQIPQIYQKTITKQEAIVMFTTKWQERSMSLSYEDSKLWKEILASQSEQGFPDF
ncbi:hypothetical protein [Dolichospermum sp. LEGE 00246]|jgi:hypothetical protein|uniref:hypothetical protein n=1 Tax=Dolichospermum sp. LEGE 00246 TaxID=1828605 RepID=UPI001882998F|nr:hypothetical protein [Dolichospermum sp. LEGE 00246]MBE9260075.1 hypothetical protein [Dolichospermum sp. LEGE 00246]